MAQHDGITEGLDCDNSAAMAGYTEQYIADCGPGNLHISVRPGTDFDDMFRAWNHDEQEYIYIKGWLWDFEPVAE